MSVKIDNMEGTTFNTNTTTVIRTTNPDLTDLASTCSQVKNFIATFFFPLTLNANTSITGTWSNILTNLVKTASSASSNIRGSVLNFGGASTPVSILSNTLNIDPDFTTIVSGFANMSRFQAGYVTLPIGNSLITPPNVISGGATTLITTGTTNGISGYGGVGASGFTLRTTVAQEVFWLYFV